MWRTTPPKLIMHNLKSILHKLIYQVIEWNSLDEATYTLGLIIKSVVSKFSDQLDDENEEYDNT